MKTATYYTSVSAGFRRAREEFTALREAVEVDRHKVASREGKRCNDGTPSRENSGDKKPLPPAGSKAD